MKEMTVKLFTAFISALMILMAVGCDDDKPPQRDLVLEVAGSMGGLYDTRSTRANELFGRYCSVCHGTEGKGDGFNAFNLEPKPRDFSDSTFISRLDTALIVETIRGGGKAVGLSGLMPPWGKTLDSTDIELLAQRVIKFGNE